MVATRRADGGHIAVGAVSQERQRAEGAHDCHTERRIHSERRAVARANTHDLEKSRRHSACWAAGMAC